MRNSDNTKARVMVLTDISSLTGGVLEPDDAQSMIRFLLYTNEFDVEGLIATAYGTHGIHPDYIRTLVLEYGKIWKNLASHDAAYPSCETLLSLVKSGSSKCGMDELGEGKDTEASDWIISAADKPDERPLWLLLWGGALDLAQAVWKVKTTRTDNECRAFLTKLRVYAIGDQYDGCGPWIRANCPELFYITNYYAFRGMYRGGDEQLTGPAWVNRNIFGHGALSECYPMYQGGDPWGEVRGIKEGDTPSFLYLIPNGIHDPENPRDARWGGQFEPVENTEECRHFSDITVSLEDAAKTVSRWRADFQEDFARRLEWCVEIPAIYIGDINET